MVWLVFQNLFPERGLKPPSFSSQGLSRISLPSLFFRTYSPKGDWNFFRSWSVFFRGIPRFSEPIPRKGTETILPDVDARVCSKSVVFQNLFPERGLKPFFWVCYYLCRLLVFQNLFPERGLKLHESFIYSSSKVMRFFRTYSPKGDWNNLKQQMRQAGDPEVFQNLFPERVLKHKTCSLWVKAM